MRTRKKRNSKNGKTAHFYAQDSFSYTPLYTSANLPSYRFEIGFYATEDPNDPSIEGTVYEFREGGFWTDECCVRDKTYIFPHARIAYDVEIGEALVDRVFAGPGTTCHSWLKEAITVMGKYDFFVEGDLGLGDLEMDRRKVEQRLGVREGW